MSLESSNQFISGNENQEISLKDLILKLGKLFSYLISKWIFLLTMGFLGLIIGASYAHFKKRQYIATTTFVLETGDSGSALSPYAGLASIAGIDLGGSGGGIFQGDNILELYKSRAMIVKTLMSPVTEGNKSELLIDVYIRFNELTKGRGQKNGLSGATFTLPSGDHTDMKFTRDQDSLLNKIVKDINRNYLLVAKPDKKLSIISAEVKAPNEFFAKKFNEEIVKNVNDFYIQTKTKKALENIHILTRKADSVRAVMNGSILSAAAAADATPNLNVARQVQRVVPMQRSQFSAETNKAILTELVKNLEMSKMSLLKERPLIQVVDKPVYPLPIIESSRIKFGILGSVVLVLLACAALSIRMFFISTLKG